MASSSSCPPSRRKGAKDSSAVTKNATVTTTASTGTPPLLYLSAESFVSSHYDSKPKHPDGFCCGCFIRRRLFFILLLLLLLTGSCDGMKNTTIPHVLKVNNNIIQPMHYENPLHDTYDDDRLVATEKSFIEHDGSRLLQQNCVYNESDLANAMSLNRNQIDLCSSYIAINSEISADSKDINFTCNLKITNGVKCKLDAQGLSRHFDTYNATINFYDIVFINGNTPDYGGAIYMNRSSVSMYRCDFMNNNANNDGGVIASYDSTVILTARKKPKASVAKNNVASYGAGGFLFARFSTITITNHFFLNNSASFGIDDYFNQHGGGAIRIEEFSTLSTYRCDFRNNSADVGGAIASYNSTLILIGIKAKAAVAENNKAANNGGFLYALGSTIDVTNHLFLHNSAGWGGAISIESSSISTYGCDFMTNFAKISDGGAISSSFSTLILTGGETKAAVAQSNKAGSYEAYGGFLSALNSIINITNHLFLNNSAAAWGGAIWIYQSSTLSTYRCDFMNNYAASGGAIYSAESSLILTGGEAEAAVAEHNAANTGGFLYAYSSTIDITNHLFRNNFALGLGGAIGIELSSTLSAFQCDFMDNHARLGGAIGSLESTLILKGEAEASVAENNEATIYGGFLHADSSTISITNHLFRNNSARNGGANFHFNGISNYENAIFQNNLALTQGGALAVAYEDMTLRNVVFKDNNALNGTIRSFSSQIDFKNFSFLSSVPTMGPCNLFVTKLNMTAFDFLHLLCLSTDLQDIDAGSPLLDSCINFPMLVSINNRRLDSKSNQAHSHEYSPIFDPNDQVYPSDHLLLTATTSSETHVSMPHNSSSQRLTQLCGSVRCVTSKAALINAVRLAKPECKAIIKLCTPIIKVGGRTRRLQYGNNSLVTNMLDGIDISNKNIVFVCSLNRLRKARRCTLDAGGVTRHFYGSNAKVQFHNIRFINGYNQGAGGALLINNSDVNLTMCSFWNNTALSGAGAVFVNQTRLIINGMETNVSQNGGSGAPIEIHSSNATVENVTFADNTMSQLGDGIFLFDSDVDLSNLSFNQSSSNMSSDCNLFVSVDPSNPAEGATCVALGQ